MLVNKKENVFSKILGMFSFILRLFLNLWKPKLLMIYFISYLPSPPFFKNNRYLGGPGTLGYIKLSLQNLKLRKWMFIRVYH